MDWFLSSLNLYGRSVHELALWLGWPAAACRSANDRPGRAGVQRTDRQCADQLIQRCIKRHRELRPNQRLDVAVGRFDLRRHASAERTAARRQRHAPPALIVIETFAGYVAQLFHARQYPREAGARNTAQFANLVRLQGSRVD